MVMRLVLILVAILAPIIAFLHWPAPAVPSAPIDVQEFGERSDASLILVEPALTASDYKSAEALHDALSSHLKEASARGWIGEKTIIIFPEHVGTWLVAASAPPLAYRAKSSRIASLSVIAGDPVGFARALVSAREPDPIAAALFRARGSAMARDYAAVFSRLAREHAATVVAGSIVLENPTVEAGSIRLNGGPLLNVSAVFDPDGAIRAPLIVKRHPIPSEATFISAGTSPMPAFDTPAGRLGILICADSWHPELYVELAREGVEIIASPAFLQGDGAWNKPWGGYVTPPPDDVDASGIGKMKEGEAWRAYSLPSRLGSTRARVGATAFLHGNLWNLGADGRTLVRSADRVLVGTHLRAGAVSVVWF